MKAILAAVGMMIVTPAFAGGTNVYFMSDTSLIRKYTAPVTIAEEKEQGGVSVERFHKEMAMAFREMVGRKYRDTSITYIDSVSREAHSYKPAELIRASRAEIIEKHYPVDDCGAYDKWFGKLNFKMRQDAPDASFVILYAPLIPVGDYWCDDKISKEERSQNPFPSLPIIPNDSLGIEVVFRQKNLREIIIVSAHSEQEIPYYDYLEKLNDRRMQRNAIVEGDQEKTQPIKITFMTTETALKQLPGIISTWCKGAKSCEL